MASPTTPKATATSSATLSSQVSASGIPWPETREYIRHAPGVGPSLDNTRNLRPDEAISTPLKRSTISTVDTTVLPDSQTTGELSFASDKTAYKVLPKYGGTKGSYISPYDSGGQVPGSKHLPYSSTTVEEFEAKYGNAARKTSEASEDTDSEGSIESDRTVMPDPGRSISFGGFPPTTIPDRSTINMVEKERISNFIEGASDRFLFLGPYKLIRTECIAKKGIYLGMYELDAWLSRYMHEDLHEVVDTDEMIRGVVYTIKIKMTDEHWLNYSQALAHFADARDLHNILVQGKEAFDHVTKVHRNEGLDQLTWPLLTVPELSLEQMLAVFVKQHRLGVPWDFARINYRPELVPEELGGSLKGYPI